MIIICPNCTTHFNVDPTVLGGGKNARCFNCSHSWFQEPVSVPPPAMPQMASYPAMAQPMSGQPISGEQPGAPPGYGQPIQPLAPTPATEPTPVPEPVPPPSTGIWLTGDPGAHTNLRRRAPTRHLCRQHRYLQRRYSQRLAHPWHE